MTYDLRLALLGNRIGNTVHSVHNYKIWLDTILHRDIHKINSVIIPLKN